MTPVNLTYSGITPEVWERLKIATKPYVEITGPVGTGSVHGFDFGWNWVAPNVVFECTGKPFFVSEASVISHVDALVGGAGGVVPVRGL